MECTHETKPLQFVSDALKTLKTIEGVTNRMTATNTDPVLVAIVEQAGREIFDHLCPKDLNKFFPDLQRDKEFIKFIQHLLDHTVSEEKN